MANLIDRNINYLEWSQLASCYLAIAIQSGWTYFTSQQFHLMFPDLKIASDETDNAYAVGTLKQKFLNVICNDHYDEKLNQLDLHGLDYLTTKHLIEHLVMPNKPIKIITGRGSHSQHQSRMKNIVLAHLNEHKNAGFQFTLTEDSQGGRIILTPNANPSKTAQAVSIKHQTAPQSNAAEPLISPWSLPSAPQKKATPFPQTGSKNPTPSVNASATTVNQSMGQWARPLSFLGKSPTELNRPKEKNAPLASLAKKKFIPNAY